jgi:hypothetical protein
MDEKALRDLLLSLIKRDREVREAVLRIVTDEMNRAGTNELQLAVMKAAR